jgi:transposase
MFQIREMNPYPLKNSVIVLDNARIHHNAEWIKIVEGLGGHVKFLPAYSPDFNPIELAFGFIKAWLQRHRAFVEILDDSAYALMMACAEITPEMAQCFFNASIY